MDPDPDRSRGGRAHHIREIAHLFLDTDERAALAAPPAGVRRFGVMSLVPGLFAGTVADWMNRGLPGSPEGRTAGYWTALSELPLEQLSIFVDLCLENPGLRSSLPGTDGLLLVVDPGCIGRRVDAYQVARYVDVLVPLTVEIVGTGEGGHPALESWARRICREIPCRITSDPGLMPPLAGTTAVRSLDAVRRRMLGS